MYPLMKSIADLLNIKLPRNGSITFAVYGKARICLLGPELETRNLLGSSTTVDLLTEPAWAPDGKKLAYTRRQSGIEISDIVSPLVTAVTDRIYSSSQPAWSPDGKSLAFVRRNGSANDIYTIDLTTKEERRLTDDGGNKGHPSWSPDGNRLVFHQFDSKSLMGAIFVINKDGSGEKRIFLATGALDPTWSPDGERIAFLSYSHDRSKVYVANADGLDPRPVGLAKSVKNDLCSPRSWLPDGRRLIVGCNSQIQAPFILDPLRGHVATLFLTYPFDSSLPTVQLTKAGSGFVSFASIVPIAATIRQFPKI